MKILSALNPQWADEAQTAINLTVDFEGVGPVPFSASPNDSEAHGRSLYAQALAGVYGPVQAVPPKPLATLKSEKIAQIDAAYNAAIQQDIIYMGFVFQADIASQDILSKTVSTLNGVGYAPPGSYWKEKGNTRVPMTLAELNGLAMAMWAQGQVAFSHKDDLKAQVAAATTDAEVAAVTW